MILRNDYISATAYDKLASIMQIKSKNIYWNSPDENMRQNIIEGFRNLYKDDKKINCQTHTIIHKMNETLNIIMEHIQLDNVEPPQIPKSRAKDQYGFCQRKIIKLIRGENMKDTIIKLQWLLSETKNSESIQLLIHNISKIILKKKKSEIKSFGDLRPIAIMPAMIMAFDKVVAKIIDKDIKKNLSANQHGGRENRSTNTAKIQMIYTMKKKGYTKILFIDLKKAFDMVDHKSLIVAIENKIKNQYHKEILKNILTIYETITIYTEECLIHPTRGVPQGSVFGPTMFLLVMDDILDYMNKDKNTHTQAFVDDIAIAGTNTQDLQQAFNKIMVAIKDKNMEINTDKCELITEDLNDNIFDETTNQTIQTKNKSKYLGQTLNNLGQTEDIILRRNYKSITALMHTSQTYITLKSRIKLFKIYIRSKYNHLLPMIAISGNIEKTWTEIRKTIFNELLKRSTQPRESATLLGCSYYSIIIKPLLKIMEQAKENDDEELLEYLIEATGKTFLYWVHAEPNHNPQIISQIKTFIEKKKTKSIKEWDQLIKEEAVERLFKYNNLPECYVTLKNLKHPNIIEILSNAPIHIIKELINKHIKNKKEPELFTLHASKYIKSYILICLLEFDEPPKINKPEAPDNINDIIEYQQLYDLYVIDKTYKINDTINNKAEEIKAK